jgi:hypothetical protein
MSDYRFTTLPLSENSIDESVTYTCETPVHAGKNVRAQWLSILFVQEGAVTTLIVAQCWKECDVCVEKKKADLD